MQMTQHLHFTDYVMTKYANMEAFVFGDVTVLRQTLPNVVTFQTLHGS